MSPCSLEARAAGEGEGDGEGERGGEGEGDGEDNGIVRYVSNGRLRGLPGESWNGVSEAECTLSPYAQDDAELDDGDGGVVMKLAGECGARARRCPSSSSVCSCSSVSSASPSLSASVTSYSPPPRTSTSTSASAAPRSPTLRLKYCAIEESCASTDCCGEGLGASKNKMALALGTTVDIELSFAPGRKVGVPSRSGTSSSSSSSSLPTTPSRALAGRNGCHVMRRTRLARIAHLGRHLRLTAGGVQVQVCYLEPHAFDERVELRGVFVRRRPHGGWRRQRWQMY